MNSTLRFYKCEEIFGELPLWKSVPETERKDIFSDVVHNLAKKEKEQAKVIKLDNRQKYTQCIFDISKNLVCVFYQYLYIYALITVYTLTNIHYGL